MTDLHKDIWARIEEQRATYASIIAKADETIRAALALKRDAREGMDALPVAKVRRPRKQGQDVIAALGMVEVDEEGERIEGFERVRTYCVDDVSAAEVPAQDIFLDGGKDDAR